MGRRLEVAEAMKRNPPPFPNPITVESAQAWIQECMPRETDRVDDLFMRLGACFVLVLGAHFDLMLDAKRKIERLDQILAGYEK